MADPQGSQGGKGNQPKPTKNPYQNVIEGLGLGDEFTALIDRAVRLKWDASQFQSALLATDRFQDMFPAIDKLMQQQNISASSLVSAVSAWKSLELSYQRAAKALGMGHLINTAAVGTLIRADKSPDEFSSAAAAVVRLREQPGLVDAFNHVRRQMGLKPLDKVGALGVIAGTSDRAFYDQYEAAQFYHSHFVNVGGAEKLSHLLGAPGAPLSEDFVNQLVGQGRGLMPDIGPELRRRGYTNEQILAGIASGKLNPVLASLQQQRRDTGMSVPGSQAQTTPIGTPTQFPGQGPRRAD